MILSVLMNECSEIINVCIHGDTLPGQLGAMFLSRSTLTSMEIFMILAATVHAACGLTRTSLLEVLTCSVGLMGLCPATVSVSPHCGTASSALALIRVSNRQWSVCSFFSPH